MTGLTIGTELITGKNLIFRENKKKFYRGLGKKEIQIADHPEKCEIKNFWKDVMEKDKKHNENAPWIKEIEDANKNIKVQEWNEITPEEVLQAIKKLIAGSRLGWTKFLTSGLK